MRALALLSARAAVALEFALKGLDTSWNDVKELADVLRRFAKKEAPGPADIRQALWQTDAAEIVDRAFAFYGGKHPTTIEDLRAEVVKLASDLDLAASGSPERDLKTLRDLCVALSRAAQTQDPVPIYHRSGADL